MTLSRSTLAVALLLLQLRGAASSLDEEDGVPEEWLLLHVVQGHVGAGNYSYLRLNHDGAVALHMRSLTGDADLYVSDQTLRPTFDAYTLQSATCGRDLVLVPAHFARPVGIAVYGHPSHRESEFEMRVFYDQTPAADPFDSEGTRKLKKPAEPSGEDLEEDESIFWTVLIGLLKIILEMLF
ncbi:UPF0669 protein C6orf120 homolog [Nerophis lumbriciformis]|uniref:UPF0669 protein C6orf120 homolog n=1 Tax=Nerophis lumbriciformis TaxID=546530 RepID=UPI002AE0881B|nr:UPF0669 protein C6orf120 homolog [Nerophis lumbriciformis]